jgi:hypothetical protein
MIVIVDRPFHDVVFGHQHERGDAVVTSDQLGATWIAIGVAHLAPPIPEQFQAEVNAEIEQAVDDALAKVQP